MGCMKSVGKLASVVKTYLRNSSIHGYHYLADVQLHPVEKVFWLFFVLLSTAIGIYVMITSTEEAQDNPITLSVNTLYLNWLTSFPAVAVCEVYSNLYYAGVPKEKYFKYLKISPEDYSSSELDNIEKWVNLITFFDKSLAKINCRENIKCSMPTNFSRASNDLKRTCSEMFDKCEMNGKPFDCCEHFLPMYSTEGKCYAINSKTTVPPARKRNTFKYQDEPKLSIALKHNLIMVYILPPEEVVTYGKTDTITGTETFNYHENSEMNVYFRVQETRNDPGVRDVPIDIRNCRFPNENNLKYAKVYSFTGCLIDVVTTLLKEKCGCVHYRIPLGIDIPGECNHFEQIECLQDNIYDFYRSEVIYQNCTISCEESELIITGFDIKRNVSTDGNIRINFFATPPTLRYERRVVRDAIDMLVNVGGIGTLFFGASILSLVEIIYYFFIYPCSKTRETVKRPKSPEVVQRKQPAFNVIRRRRTQLPYLN